MRLETDRQILRAALLGLLGAALILATNFAISVLFAVQTWSIDRQAERLLSTSRDWTQQIPYCAECIEDLRQPR